MQKKWNSQQGATILLALLFLLVCMMVASSVLMAAASNAGKIRSNQEEQQKYLTLSSALRLVCGELTAGEYRGQYRYASQPRYRTELDADGNPIPVFDHWAHSYTQEKGSFTGWALDDNLLPLIHDLDALFARSFDTLSNRTPGDEYTFTPRPAGQMQPQGPHTLTLTVTPGTDTPAGLSQPVTVTISVRPTGVILLTAVLGEAEEGVRRHVMEAELRPNQPPGRLLVPDGPLAGDGTYQTQPMKWTLSWMAKKEAEA